MPRIAGVDLPRDKRVGIGLTYHHGICRSRSNVSLVGIGVQPDTRWLVAEGPGSGSR